MDSNPLLNPVGSLPPEVYWRRRAMAGLLAVLVIWLAWSWFPGKSGGANAAQPKNPVKSTTSAHTTPSPTPTAVVTTAAPVVTTKAAATVTSPAATTTTSTTTAPATPKCASSAIKITLTADHTLYPSGVSPHFVLTVANVSGSACRIDVGTANRGFLVTSGNDRIWSSSDCSKTSPNVATFKPKDTVGYSHTWTRQRSSAAGCAAAGTAARPGTYKVVAHLGDLISATMVFRLA